MILKISKLKNGKISKPYKSWSLFNAVHTFSICASKSRASNKRHTLINATPF